MGKLVKDLKANPENPRTITAEKLNQLQRSMDEYGDISGIVFNVNTGNVVGGTQRTSRLDETSKVVITKSFSKPTKRGTVAIGYIELDGERFSYREVAWTKKKEKGASIAANKAAGEWDVKKLGKVIKDLSAFDADFNLDLTMFDKDELVDFGFITTTVREHERNSPTTGVDEDEVPEKPPARTKLGDIYQLGRHRLLCGDSTRAEEIDRLMGIEKADMVFTDPPYGIGRSYNSYDDSEEKWFGLIDKIIPIAKANADFVLLPCCRIKALPWWYKNYPPDWIMCWYKGSPGHRSHVGFNDWEPHLVWGKPKNPMHDYWQTACGFEIDGHPCPKPVAYCEWVLQRAINPDDIVLDLFLGSGSTLIACEKTNRKCFGMEIDPHYCDVIVDRWEKYTGEKAELISPVKTILRKKPK